MNKLIFMGIVFLLIGCPGDQLNQVTKSPVRSVADSPASPVPEPASMAIFGAGLISIAWWRRK